MMWTILKSFIIGNIFKISEIVLSVLSVAGLILSVRQSGKNAEKVEILKKQSERVEKSHEIEDSNRKLSDNDVVVRLSEWQRD